MTLLVLSAGCGSDSPTSASSTPGYSQTDVRLGTGAEVVSGSLLTVTDGDLLLLVGVGVIVAVLVFREYNRLLLDSLSPPIATVAGAHCPVCPVWPRR